MKEKLEKLINDGCSTWQMAISLNMDQSKVRRELKKYGLKTRLNRCNKKTRKCLKCGEKDKDKFYKDNRSYCKSCHNIYYINKGKRTRDRAIAVLGGKCSNPSCGYNEHSCSLDFHHTDPKSKDRNFNSMRGWSWDRVEKEIRGCILLCKNCHAAFHSGFLKL